MVFFFFSPFTRIILGADRFTQELSHYGIRLHSRKKYKEAIRIHSRALESDNHTADYWYNRGVAKYESAVEPADYEDAVKDLTNALNCDESIEVAFLCRGYAYASLQNFEQALSDLSKFSSQSPDDWNAVYFRGTIREHFNHWHAALDDYLLAHKLDSSQKEPIMAVARLYAGCPDDLIRNGNNAVELATTACELCDWKDWAYVSVLAAAYAEAKDFELALDFASQALELAPEEEKPERKNRIEQFQKRIPFRIPAREETKEEAESDPA